jgi:TATA-binding protein-associated factor
MSGADERAPVSTSEWTVGTVGRLRAIKALSQLAGVLVHTDAGATSISTSSLAAAAALEAQVVRLMSAPSATWRMTGAHLLSQWLTAIPAGSPRPALQVPGARLAQLMAATNPAYPSPPSPVGVLNPES